jgi:putative FmdB family regulatory protein
MPLYDYICPACGLKENIWAKMNEQLKLCPDCDNIMERTICYNAANILCDIEPYMDQHMVSQAEPDPVLVKSRQHKKQLLKERGLVQK